MVYEIMHAEKRVAQISTVGDCEIFLEDFMPYDLVQKIGLNQVSPIEETVFAGHEPWRKMFHARLDERNATAH